MTISSYDATEALKLINRINEEPGYEFLTKPYFDSIEEENKVVELFSQKKENPEKYTGEKIKHTLHFKTASGHARKISKEELTLLKNYLHNVGGEICNNNLSESNQNFKGTIYINIPKNAPYKDKLEEQIHNLLWKYEMIQQRVILRKTYGKQLPERRPEERFLGKYGYGIGYYIERNLIAGMVIIVLALITLLFQ